MLILGIETSCDETSASIVKDGNDHCLKYNNLSRQNPCSFWWCCAGTCFAKTIGEHRLGSERSMDRAQIPLTKIDAIAVTYGPGLAGSLLVGVEFAKSLSYSLSIPLVGVNHIHAHLYSNFLEGHKIEFPYIGLVISGGHTSLFYVEDFMTYSFLGQTRDDACGEAFDKGAQILNLGYPGGPVIDRISKRGNPKALKFPRAHLENKFDFSFSGLKTSLLRYVEKRGKISKKELPDIAASFQEAIVDVLVNKAILAAEHKKTDTIVVGGGVAANSRIRTRLEEEGKRKNYENPLPNELKLCTDNGAMVAGLGYWMLKRGIISSSSLDAQPNLQA